MAIHLLPSAVMAQVVAIYHDSPLRSPDGHIYTARACGREREDGIWEGWFEFVADDASAVLRSERETTQPSLADLEYWASGIRRVYLEGALERTLTPPPVVVEPPIVQPVFDEPAPPKQPVRVPSGETTPALDPFSAYRKGEEVLRQDLTALSPWHLRAIIIGYEFANPAAVDLDALTTAELIEFIVTEVRTRMAS